MSSPASTALTDVDTLRSSTPVASAPNSAASVGLGRPPRAGASLPANPGKLSRFVANARKVVSGPTSSGGMPAMTGIYLGDLHWWTTDTHLVALCDKLGAPIELKNVSFSEHKVNGKSKGVAYVEFETEAHAKTVKDWFDANEFQHHKMNAQLSAGSGGQNPFKTLPKEPYLRSASTPTQSAGAGGGAFGRADAARSFRNTSGGTAGDSSIPPTPSTAAGGVASQGGSRFGPNAAGNHAQGHAAAQTASLLQQQAIGQQMAPKQQQPQVSYAPQQQQPIGVGVGMGWGAPPGLVAGPYLPGGGMIPPELAYAGGAGQQAGYWAPGVGQAQAGMMMMGPFDGGRVSVDAV